MSQTQVDTLAMSTAIVPTTPLMSCDEVRWLSECWVRSPSLYAGVRDHLRADAHFRYNTLSALVFEVLGLALHRYGEWNLDVLSQLLVETAQTNPLFQTSASLDQLIRRSPGGFLWDAFAKGPLSALEMQNAEQAQERFLREQTVFLPLRNFANPSRNPSGRPEVLRPFIEALLAQDERISRRPSQILAPIGQCWTRHEEQLERFRGRSLVGLETGFRPIDQRLLGLRGVTLLGAGPGVGKTVLALQWAVGVCRRHAFNQAVAVFISLELPADALLTRVKCHLTETDWSLYTRGCEQPDGSFLFTPELMEARRQAETAMQTQGIGDRLFIAERRHLTNHTADNIFAIVEDAKRRARASRALVVIDYLQLLELPEDRKVRSDLDADKARFRILQQVQEKSRTPQNPDGDAVLAISEARKPVGDSRKNQLWGTQLADLMGSSRLGYGADAVLFLHTMTKDELNQHYEFSNDAPETRIEQMRGEGRSPLILRVAKGRDGMTLGDIPLEFQYRRSTITPLEVRQQAPRPSLPTRRQRTAATIQQEAPQS